MNEVVYVVVQHEVGNDDSSIDSIYRSKDDAEERLTYLDYVNNRGRMFRDFRYEIEESLVL